jgi:hypothetical protein
MHDMSRMGRQYEIARSTGRCAVTGETFEPGASYITALVDRVEDEGLDRLDYSISAWEEGARPDRLFSFWRTRMPEAGEERQQFVDDEILMNLWERLADDDRPRRIAFRFVLGLLLIRKKLLKLDHSEWEGDTEYWLVRTKGTPRDVSPDRMINPQLSEDDVAGVTEQLSEILNGDL